VNGELAKSSVISPVGVGDLGALVNCEIQRRSSVGTMIFVPPACVLLPQTMRMIANQLYLSFGT